MCFRLGKNKKIKSKSEMSGQMSGQNLKSGQMSGHIKILKLMSGQMSVILKF